MTTEEKFKEMWATLLKSGPVTGRFELAPIHGHTDYTVTKLWAVADFEARIFYSTPSFSECWISHLATNYSADVQHLYEQLKDIVKIDRNLF